jgi:DNA-binding XRE family transcriptional regulator
MAHPRRSAPASAPRTSSVALSLASAAAALRAQEWHDDDARGRPDAGYSRYASSHNFQEEQDVAYDREAFYEELRAHHRSLTQRQRLARELFNQQTQTQNFMPQNQTPNLRRPQWQGRRYQTHSPVSSADAAGGHYRAAYAASPAVQLVATMVPRAQINVDRRLSAGQMEPDRIIIENQRDSKPTQMQLPSPGSGQRLASPGAGQGPGGSDTRWPQAAAPARKPSSTDEADENVQKPPSVVEDPDNDDDADAEAAVVEDDAGKKKQKKRVRYLRDTDRRNIIKRIENGEKQAALAREFGVTRAAICHIKKNRFEILSRYNLLVKSAQEM